MTLKDVRSIALCAVASLGSTLVLAQTPAASTPDSAMSGNSSAMAGKSSDKMFLHKAAAGGMAEVQLGQLALQKSSSDDVKQFAQKMIDDHTALNAQLKPFADADGVMTPTKLAPKDQAEYDKLNGMSGDAFDKEYLSFMVKDHHMDLREFKKEESTTQDASLKDAVSKGETVIQQHTDMVEKLAKDKGAMHKGASSATSGQ